jgi:hypothetical protein
MNEAQKEPVVVTKKKIARCDKTCTYVSGGKEPRPCKSKCSREVGHILNCKCRSHEMQ